MCLRTLIAGRYQNSSEEDNGRPVVRRVLPRLARWARRSEAVLTISLMKSADYYLDAVGADYYLKGGEPPGEWFGRGAAQPRAQRHGQG